LAGRTGAGRGRGCGGAAGTQRLAGGHSYAGGDRGTHHARSRTSATCRGNGSRRRTRHRARDLTGRLLLDTDGGGGRDALLEVGRPLGRAAGPLTQPLELACLGEDEQRQDRDTDQRGERRDCPDLGERAR
jgi:hypothetical protein